MKESVELPFYFAFFKVSLVVLLISIFVLVVIMKGSSDFKSVVEIKPSFFNKMQF